MTNKAAFKEAQNGLTEHRQRLKPIAEAEQATAQSLWRAINAALVRLKL